MNDKAKPAPASSTLWLMLIFALLLPSVVTWLYFVALADQPAWLQQAAYLGGKAIQFALPVAWVVLFLRQRLQFAPPSRNELLLGGASGLAILLAMLGLYHLGLKPLELLVVAESPVREKIAGFGIDTLWKYAALALFYSLVHSLAEEYYWRWFVFGQLQKVAPQGVAVAVSSLGFMAHHVIVLGMYFGYDNPACWVFSAGVAIGGVIWALVYLRYERLWGVWLSHLLVDAGIFIVGYDMAKSLFHVTS